jgi:DNA-directed RNA polymerase specialized sigma24 family protein
VTDGELPGGFTGRGDESAFAELVRRHGPMVLSVCRGVLRHGQDAEDAF